jgi:hypothetical protein
MEQKMCTIVEHDCPSFFKAECSGVLGVFKSSVEAIQWVKDNVPFKFKCERHINTLEEPYFSLQMNYIRMYDDPNGSLMKS